MICSETFNIYYTIPTTLVTDSANTRLRPQSYKGLGALYDYIHGGREDRTNLSKVLKFKYQGCDVYSLGLCFIIN
jgi:hypothetical protein